MDWEAFDAAIFSGHGGELVCEEVLEFFVKNASCRVVKRDASTRDTVLQEPCVRSAFVEHSSQYDDEQLLEIARSELADAYPYVHKSQFRDKGRSVRVLEVWRHGYGFSVFARNE